MNIIRRLFQQAPPIEDPNTLDPEDMATDEYTLELAAILARLDADDEDDTANFDLIEQEYDQ